MYQGVKKVEPMPDYRLLLTFENGQRRIFDVKPYMSKGIFSDLTDDSLFRSVHISFDTVAWNNGADLCPEVLYAESRDQEKGK